MLNDVCLTLASDNGAMIATSVVTVFSVLANFVKADTKLGKLINFFAINFKVNKKA